MAKFINRKDDSISLYFKDIKDYKLIKPEEELELARRIKEHDDEKAIEKLVMANLRFVISVAKDYQNQGMPLADLISDGNYGLIKAAKRFDYSKGFKFISYAVHWVKQSILQSLYENTRTMRLPINVINDLIKVKKSIEKFESKFGRKPYEHEIKRIKYPTCGSLNEIINEEGDELINILVNPNYENPEYDDITENGLKKALSDTLDILDERERFIVNSYYGIIGESMTLEMIGDEVDLTKERVRQIKEKALRKLRNGSCSLFDFVD